MALQTDANIRPAHSRVLGAVELVLLPVADILEVVNTSIVVVLTGENDVVEVAGMSIGDWVTVRVPSSEACSIVRLLHWQIVTRKTYTYPSLP